jgi:hypothetical protein
MTDETITGKKVKVEPMEPPKTSIDVDSSLEAAIMTAASEGNLNTGTFESFSTVAQTRESSYELIDTMAMDSTIAAAIETYAEDVTQPNAKGEIFWVESDDAACARYVDYLLKKADVDKQAFSWAYNLVKYGDVYLRLLRESDFKNSKIFNSEIKVKDRLQEDVNLMVSQKNDHYAHTLEMIKNPNEMFELTKFGKTIGYVKAGVNVQKDFSNNNEVSYYTKYRMSRKDVEVYSPTDFVHACLETSTSRSEEELDIFLNDKDYKENVNAETFQVKRGAGILNDLFKVWRQLSLLENSILLNRLTKSSFVRAIQVEVGDMPANQVMNVTTRIKSLIEQKSAIDTGNRMSEYTNPGPIENSIILPTRNGKGALSINQIGGDVDPKQLTDLDWFNNKLFGGLKIPKQYFGWTDDSAGFSGGQSLAQYSSRYGKTVKRIQTCLCQMITDYINLILIDTGNKQYINNFHIKMQAPITQEEVDRKNELSSTLRNISDIMNTLNDIQSPAARLKILKSLLSECLSEQDVINVLQDEIDKLEAEANGNAAKSEETTDEDFYGDETFGGGSEGSEELSLSSRPEEGAEEGFEETSETSEFEGTEEPTTAETTAAPETAAESETLPSFADLGVDGTINL